MSDLLAPGLASAAVIAALALFLWQAARERLLDREVEQLDETAAKSAGVEEPAAGD